MRSTGSYPGTYPVQLRGLLPISETRSTKSTNSVTLITGTLKDSGANLLSGTLTVTLAGEIVDVSTTPDTIYTLNPAVFTITNGAINITLPQSQTQNTTYHFVFAIANPTTAYYLQDGTLYTGPNHLWTDSAYYTGTVHTSDSKVLSQVVQNQPVTVLDFNAIVPNVASVDFSQLIPTGVSDSVLDTSIAALANLLTTNATYAQALRGGPIPQGAWNNTQFYKYGDFVTFGGSSWLYVNAIPTQNQSPSLSNTVYWQQIAAQGAPGGTGGTDTAYDSSGWDGATFAPTANAIRDVIVTLATQAQLANYLLKNNGVLDGNPTRSTVPTFGDRSSQLATTQWTGTEFATIASPTLTGNPAAPTQPTADRSNKIASTQWVDNYFVSKSLSNVPYFVLQKTTAQSLSNGANAIAFNTTVVDTNSATVASTGTFTVPAGQAGWYEFVGNCYVERSAGTTWSSFLELVFGATTYRLSSCVVISDNGRSLNGSVQLYLNAGQSVSLQVTTAGSATLAMQVFANYVLTNFSGKRLLL